MKEDRETERIPTLEMIRNVLLLLILTLTVAPAVFASRDPAHTAEPEGNCDGAPFGRKQIWDCVLNVVDTDRNGRITASEVDSALETYLYRTERWLLRAAAGNTAQHMEDCCGSADCVMTYDTVIQHTDTCLDTQKNRCRFKEKVCDRAAEASGKKVY